MIGSYDTLVGEFEPTWPRIGSVVPQVEWWGWLILLLVVVIIAVVEGAYHLDKKTIVTQVNRPKNKIALVAKAIMQAKQITPIGQDISVYIMAANELDQVYPSELKDILSKLQDVEKVIAIKAFPDWLMDEGPSVLARTLAEIQAIQDPSRKKFVVVTHLTFDRWYRKKCRT